MSSYPIAIIGAGPVGLAAAAHVLKSGSIPLVFESGGEVADSVRQWGHVRLFSPWRFLIDEVSRTYLSATGWKEPDLEALPTGKELVREYLEPLARVPQLKDRIHLHSRVLAVARARMDKLKSAEREKSLFLLRVQGPDGAMREFLARAVIDASGTWQNPSPMGTYGLFALGEPELHPNIQYGIPNVLGAQRERYQGKRVLVVGAGHSAINALLDLVKLRKDHPSTQLFWGMRRVMDSVKVYGGGESDRLPARGALGQRLREAVEAGSVTALTELRIARVERVASGIAVIDVDGRERIVVDEIIVATGARPDLTSLRELRLQLDPALESPAQLAEMIDPNVHSCGTVRPHGAFQLQHPEKDFFIVGMKSYGRAPTFLLATGYEQVRSVVAYLHGDFAAAARVDLELPETGVCGASPKTGKKEKEEKAASREKTEKVRNGSCC